MFIIFLADSVWEPAMASLADWHLLNTVSRFHFSICGIGGWVQNLTILLPGKSHRKAGFARTWESEGSTLNIPLTLKGRRYPDVTEILSQWDKVPGLSVWISILLPVCATFLLFGNLYNLSQFSHLQKGTIIAISWISLWSWNKVTLHSRQVIIL